MMVKNNTNVLYNAVRTAISIIKRDDFDEIINCLVKYGHDGILDFEICIDFMDDIMCTYLMFDAIAGVRGEGCSELGESLSVFIARVKLDCQFSCNNNTYESLPEFITMCGGPIGDGQDIIKVPFDYISVNELSLLWSETVDTVENKLYTDKKIREQLKTFDEFLCIPVELACELSKHMPNFKMSYFKSKN